MSVEHFDYALLCNASYALPEDIQTKAGKWQLVNTFESYFNYLALTFRYIDQIIIIHHTKVNKEVDIINNALIYQQLIPIHVLIAIGYTSKIQAEYSGKYTYSHTGHSIGGAVAEFVALYTQAEAVTFDAPGIKDIAGKFIDNTTQLASLLTSYVSFPNIINTLGEHLSSPIMLTGFTLAFSRGISIEDYLIYSLRHHNMDNMMEMLNSQHRYMNISLRWPNSLVKGYEWFIDYKMNQGYLDKFLSEAWDSNPILATICNRPTIFLGYFVSIRSLFSSPMFFGEANFEEFKKYMLENELDANNSNIAFIEEKAKNLLNRVVKDKYIIKLPKGIINVLFQLSRIVNTEFDNDHAEYLCSTKLSDELSSKLCESMGYLPVLNGEVDANKSLSVVENT